MFKRLFPLCLSILILSLFIGIKSGYAEQIEAQINKVVDGDTVRVSIAGEKKPVRVRLYGIDAPEKNQPSGPESSEALARLLPVGSAVLLDVVDRDHYGRLVAIITRQGENESANARQVSDGWAWYWSRYCKRPLCESWESLSESAKAAGLGLWSNDHPVAPWDWRRQRRR
jgi:micrococcal nuclease